MVTTFRAFEPGETIAMAGALSAGMWQALLATRGEPDARDPGASGLPLSQRPRAGDRSRRRMVGERDHEVPADRIPRNQTAAGLGVQEVVIAKNDHASARSCIQAAAGAAQLRLAVLRECRAAGVVLFALWFAFRAGAGLRRGFSAAEGGGGECQRATAHPRDQCGQLGPDLHDDGCARLPSWKNGLRSTSNEAKEPVLLVRGDRDVRASVVAAIASAAKRAGFETLWAAGDPTDQRSQRAEGHVDMSVVGLLGEAAGSWRESGPSRSPRRWHFSFESRRSHCLAINAAGVDSPHRQNGQC